MSNSNVPSLVPKMDRMELDELRRLLVLFNDASASAREVEELERRRSVWLAERVAWLKS